MDKLKTIQKRETMKRLKGLLHEKGLRNLEQVSLEQGCHRQELINVCKYLKEGCKEDGARLSIHWWAGTESETEATNWNTRCSFWTSANINVGCPVNEWSLPSGRYLPLWTWPQASSCTWPFLIRERVRLEDLQRPLPISTILVDFLLSPPVHSILDDF